MHFNIKPWSNNVLKLNTTSTLDSKPLVTSSSKAKLYRQSSPESNLNTATYHSINPTPSSIFNDVSNPSSTLARSNPIPSSRSHQTQQSTPKSVTKLGPNLTTQSTFKPRSNAITQSNLKSTTMPRPNLITQSNYKYHQVTDIKTRQSSTDVITTASTSISSTTVHPKFRPKVSSKPTTHQKLKSTVKTPSYSTQHSQSTSNVTLQATVLQQQSNIITNASVNNYWVSFI